MTGGGIAGLILASFVFGLMIASQTNSTTGAACTLGALIVVFCTAVLCAVITEGRGK